MFFLIIFSFFFDHTMWDLISPILYLICAPCIGKFKSCHWAARKSQSDDLLCTSSSSLFVSQLYSLKVNFYTQFCLAYEKCLFHHWTLILVRDFILFIFNENLNIHIYDLTFYLLFFFMFILYIYLFIFSFIYV